MTKYLCFIHICTYHNFSLAVLATNNQGRKEGSEGENEEETAADI